MKHPSSPRATPWVRRLFLVCTGLILLAGCSKQEADTQKVSRLIEGQPFPVLTLTTLDGKQTRFNPQQDKVIIFNAWGTWCPPCRKELPSLQRLNEKLDSERFTLVLMAMDTDPLVVREYFIDKQITLNSFIDQDLSITKEILDLQIYPTTFIIDRHGILRHTLSGEIQWDNPEAMQLITRVEHAF